MKVFLSFNKNFILTILRPGTVCGFSERMRLDTVLNIFCHQALFNKEITIYGGSQIRPLININDMIRIYEFAIKKAIKGIFNVGNDVLRISDIAKIVAKKTGSKLIIKKSNDPRSYRLNSDKILKKGFIYKYNFLDSIESNLKNIPAMSKFQLDNSNNLRVLKTLIKKGKNLLLS